MKKFKKSFVILPALATMALTTVASVTGTVAWFTANQTATVTSSVFKVGTNEGDLKVTISDGQGITATTTTSANEIVTVSDGVVLLDASYDGSQAWTDVPNGASSNLYQTVNQTYKAYTDSDTTKYYYYISWRMTFTIDISNTGNSNYDIFFDTSSTATDSAAKAMATAFRVYFGSTQDIVWAPLDNITTINIAGGHVKDASSTETYTSASTTAHGLIAKDDTALSEKAAGKGTGNTNRGDYLGTTTADNTTKTAKLNVNVVVWYDGLDVNMKTENLSSGVGSTISANMKFYARESAN